MQAIWWSCGCHCCRSSWNMPQWTWMHIVLSFPLENKAGESCGIQGQTYLGRGLPPPPPRATLRSVVFGQQLVYRSFGRSDLMAPLGPDIKLSNQLSPGIMQDFWKKELLGQGQTWKSVETSLKPLWCVTASGLFSSNKMRSTGQPCSIGSAKPLPSICLSSKDPDFLQDPGLLASPYHTDSIGRTVRSTVSATWLIWAELICDLTPRYVFVTFSLDFFASFLVWKGGGRCSSYKLLIMKWLCQAFSVVTCGHGKGSYVTCTFPDGEVIEFKAQNWFRMWIMQGTGLSEANHHGAIEVLVGGGAPPVDPDVVTKLPRASPPGMSVDEEGQVEAPKVGKLR